MFHFKHKHKHWLKEPRYEPHLFCQPDFAMNIQITILINDLASPHLKQCVTFYKDISREKF